MFIISIIKPKQSMRSFLFLFIFLQMQLNAQTPVKCVVDAIMSEKKISINQHIKACGSHEMINQYALKCQPKQSATNGINQKQSSMVYTLPVVVHVVSNGDAVGMGENISDLQVLSQIDKLNDDFRLLNADATSIPAVFAGLAADVEIEFCLAQRKPDGSPTNGIDRITIAQADWVQAQIESNLKPPTIWDREKYINIWVVRLNAAEPLNGYAYLPYPPADIDGIVVGHDAFGTVGTLVSPTNQGRTCVHEMGHFFDLNHIWGDEDGCASDDGISDTPLQKSNNTGCPTFPLITGLGAACSGAAGAMYMNYMDYTNDACMAMFTLGQKVKMLAALTGPRSSLLSSNGCMPTSAPPIANFTATGTSICAGGNVLFENTSNFATSYTWTFAGGTPATSTGINPNITYNTAGVYAVTLTATNAFGSDLQSYAAYINVNNCGITPCQSITTVVPSSLSFFTYPAGDGYLSGHNAFGDKAKANYFNYAGSPTTVNSIRMYFHKAYSSSPSGFVKYCVWDNDGPGGSPGSLLGSQNVLIDHINDSLFSGFYRYSAALSTPIPVNGGFYAGVQYSYPSTSGTDTIALLSSGAGVLTSAGATAWEQLSSGAWVDFSTSHAINISHHVENWHIARC
jgi:PKD repeat protein